MRDPRRGRDLAVRATDQFGAREQGEEHLQAGRLECAATLGALLLTSRALALHEYEQGRLIQKSVARGVDELHASGSQLVGQRRRDVVGHEKWPFGTNLKLMQDGSQRRRPKTALYLSQIADVPPTEVENNGSISPIMSLSLHDSKAQAEWFRGV
jgi:hypothetical protein